MYRAIADIVFSPNMIPGSRNVLMPALDQSCVTLVSLSVTAKRMIAKKQATKPGTAEPIFVKNVTV